MPSGATYALTYFFRGKEGDALDRYIRTANDLLLDPDGTLERVEDEYERQVEAVTDGDGQTGLEECEAALRERFAQVEASAL